MDTEKFWSTTEMNRFLYEQLKTMCATNGFVLSPRKARHLVRVEEHYIQLVYPEISRNRMRIHVVVSPAGSFANYFYADKMFCPHGDKKDDIYSFYYHLAIRDTTSHKQVYDIQQAQTLWAEIIEPQFNREIFSCLDAFSYDHFLVLSERPRYEGFQYCSCPGNDDALRFLSKGYSEIWKGNFEKSIPLLEQALSGFNKGIEMDKQFGREVSQDDRENFDAAIEVLTILKANKLEVETQLLDKMREFEQIALNKAWGVALSPDGKTVRLKKKELL